MKPNLISSNSFLPSTSLAPTIPVPFLTPSKSLSNHSISFVHPSFYPSRFPPICFSNPTKQSSSSLDSSVELGGGSNHALGEEELERNLNVQEGNPIVPSFIQQSTKLSLNDQAFFLFTFIACTVYRLSNFSFGFQRNLVCFFKWCCLPTCVAFTGLVIAAIPTLFAMRRAATSLSKLADTAREELPSTMAAIRLSGMEISDLTLELSDLSHEIADGVNKSAQAVQAAEAGIRQIGTLAHQHTISMIQERASLPIISLQPVVIGAAKKTSHAVGQATKNLMNMISREFSSENDDNGGIGRVDM